MNYNRRLLLKSFGAMAAASMAPHSTFAQGVRLPNWAPPSFSITNGDPAELNKFALVYYGTPNDISEFSCSDDLALMRHNIDWLKADYGLDMVPVFICPYGEGENLDAALTKDFVVLQGQKEPMIDFVRSNKLALFFTDANGNITNHTRFALLFDDRGRQLLREPAENIASVYANAIQDACTHRLGGPDACEHSGFVTD